MAYQTEVHITSGVPDTNTGSVHTLDAVMADGGLATIGTSTDSARTATDATAVTLISINKQISKTLQNAVSSAAQRLITTLVDASNSAITFNPNGSATMANAAPVTIATDQLWGASTGATVPTRALYAGFDVATGLPSSTAVGQLVGGMSDKFGRQVIINNTIRDLATWQSTNIATTTATTIVTAVSSVFCDITCLLISNNTAASNTTVTISDGTNSFKINSYGGAAPVGIPSMVVPIAATSANTAWTATCASTSNIDVAAFFIKNK